MIFSKPPDIRYTDMAIWIDNHAYEPDCDDLTLYKYLYLLVEMLARKHKFFNQAYQYEDFTLFATSYFFERLKSTKQYQLKDNGNTKLQKVVSILNYMKNSLFGLKKNFEKTTFSQYNQDPTEWGENPNIDRAHIIGLYRSTSDYNACEFALCLKDLPRCVWETCKRTPYSKDPYEIINIYTSVLLTILNQITIPNKIREELITEGKNYSTSTYFVDKLFKTKDPLEDVVLFHLNEKMRNYILFLANRSKKVLVRDLAQVIQSWEPSEAVIENLIRDQVEQYLGKDNYED